jgi:EpsI family protein
MRRGRVLAALLMIGVTGALAHAAHDRGPQPQAHLAALPTHIATWSGQDAAPLDEETVRILGADAYLQRSYDAGHGAPVDLYVAYYGRQRPGASIHSPLHCLPGTGWEPLDIATVPITLPDGSVGELRRLLVRKNMDRAVVLYWYAVHGRAIANETFSKAWLLHDSLLLQGSDAALVRIVVPVHAAAVEDAQREGLAFAQQLLPFLPRLWS